VERNWNSQRTKNIVWSTSLSQTPPAFRWALQQHDWPLSHRSPLLRCTRICQSENELNHYFKTFKNRRNRGSGDLFLWRKARVTHKKASAAYTIYKNYFSDWLTDCLTD
jgi:hypothetical protein